MKKTTLLVWALLTTGLLLAVGLAYSVPALADQQDHTPKPLAMPQATPQPIPTATPVPPPAPPAIGFEEFADGLCSSGQTAIEETFQEDDWLAFVWYIDDTNGNWGDIPEEYEDFVPTFWIERAAEDFSKGKDELTWRIVATVKDDFRWEGQPESGGLALPDSLD